MGRFIGIGEMEPRATGKSAELFFVDGRPDGILAAEVSWNSAIFVTSATNNLNKAQVRHLEVRLIGLARTIGTTLLENQTTLPRPTL